MNKLKGYLLIAKKYNGVTTLRCRFSDLYEDKGLIVLESKKNFVYQLTGEKRKIITKKTKTVLFPKKWYNVFLFFDDNEIIHHAYCNISAPVEKIGKNKFCFIDFDLDVVVSKNFDISIIDQEDFMRNKEKYHYPQETIIQVNHALSEILNIIKTRKFPFDWDTNNTTTEKTITN